jgi:hypothetical protein
MNITGKTKIYKGKYGYSCSISNKKQDGSYSNMFMQIQLPKGIEPEDKSTIEITRGFISFYENKDGNKIPKIVALEIKQDEPKQEENYFTPESDLPF